MSNPSQNKPGPPEGKGPPPQPPTNLGRSLMGWVVIIGLVLLLMTFLRGSMDQRRPIDIIEFWTYVENGQVTGEVLVQDDDIRGENTADVILGKDKPRKFLVEYSYTTNEKFTDRLETAIVKHGHKASVRFKKAGWWQTILPHLLLTVAVFAAIWFLLLRRLGAAAGGAGILGNFGRSKHRVSNKEQTKVTFDDVAGIEEAKEELAEIIEFLRNPQRFQRLGGRIPRGVLLIGEPGCGKTLLAKAIAGQADVPFFSISGSDFVEMFVGVGASRVRDLFKQAKDNSPCIIFLDEIDAVGRRRGATFGGGGHDEREQTLNAILVEMDGFDSSDQVIVIAATNRMDILDPALTRPGRFDRQISVPLPDLQGRYEILKIYADKVKCSPNVDLQRLARGTPMFSGADLAALVNEAAIAATLSNKEYVEQADLEEARDKVRWGRARKNRAIDEKEREITAYHEAGHTIVQVLCPQADPLHKVSIIPRGQMGGATFALPEKDRYLYTRKYCQALLSVCFGGRVAEELFCHDVSSGAANDIAQATEIARKMVLDWGMSERLGLIHYSDENKAIVPDFGPKEYSDKTADLIDQEVKAIIDEAYGHTSKLIEANRDKLQRLAQALLKYETLGADEVQQVMDGKPLDKPTVSDLLEIEHAKAAEAPQAEAAGDVGPLPEPGV